MPEVIVDGGMDPQGEKSGRFCLGALSNIHRGEASEKARWVIWAQGMGLDELWRYFRIHIGHGLHLQHLPDGRVVLQSLSKIFVQSGYLDFCDGCPYGSKVHRFTQESPPTTVRNGMSFHREKRMIVICSYSIWDGPTRKCWAERDPLVRHCGPRQPQ